MERSWSPFVLRVTMFNTLNRHVSNASLIDFSIFLQLINICFMNYNFTCVNRRGDLGYQKKLSLLSHSHRAAQLLNTFSNVFVLSVIECELNFSNMSNWAPAIHWSDTLPELLQKRSPTISQLDRLLWFTSSTSSVVRICSFFLFLLVFFLVFFRVYTMT